MKAERLWGAANAGLTFQVCLHQTPLKSSNSSATAVESAVALLTAAADPVRWTILRRLTAGQACVCELQAEVAVAPNLLSYHLRVLREAELVTCARRGRWIDYQLAGDAMERLTAALPGTRRAEL